MQAIDVEFASRVALRDALLDTFSEGGIFIEGNYDVTAGSAVVVRLGAVGLPAGEFLEGIVQWRRVGPSRSRDMVAGLGVRVLTSQRERFAFLSRWASGTHGGSGRVDWRYPLERKVFLATLGRSTGRVLHSTIKDVSEHGAMLATPTKLAAGTLLSLEDPQSDGVRTLSGVVVWSDDTHAGFRLDLDRGEERACWHRTFESAMASFGRQLAYPRLPSERPSSRG